MYGPGSSWARVELPIQLMGSRLLRRSIRLLLSVKFIKRTSNPFGLTWLPITQPRLLATNLLYSPQIIHAGMTAM